MEMFTQISKALMYICGNVKGSAHLSLHTVGFHRAWIDGLNKDIWS